MSEDKPAASADLVEPPENKHVYETAEPVL
jgi:hypothetical protein